MDYVFIKDNKIINIALFDNPTEETLELFKNESDCDLLIQDPNKEAILGGTWDGVNFISPKPYPSWILNSDKEWEAPIPFPQYEEGKYPDYLDEETFPAYAQGAFAWDEESLTWQPYRLIE